MNKNSSTRSDLDQLRRPGWIATGAAPVFAAAAGAAATVDMKLSWLLITYCLVSALCFGIVGVWTLILVGQMEASEDQRVRGSEGVRPSRYPSDR